MLRSQLILMVAVLSFGQANGDEQLDQNKAIESLKRLGGQVVRDETLPEKPVIEVRFSYGAFGDEHVPILNSFKQLRTLDVFRCLKITDAGLKHIKELNSLRSLKLEDTNITDAGIKELVELDNLTRLQLRSHRISDKGIAELSGLKSLKVLQISFCDEFTGIGLMSLGNVADLTIFCCDNFADLASLKGMQQLTTLTLWECQKVTNAEIQELKELKKLTSLQVENCLRISDQGWSELNDCKSLKTLSLSGNNITNTALRRITELGELNHLTSLTVASENVSDLGMEAFFGFPALTNLTLEYCDVTDTGIEVLTLIDSHFSLQSLRLIQCRRISNAVLSKFKEFPELKSLELTGCERLTAAGLSEIRALKHLTSLTLRDSNIGDAELKQLQEFKSLTTLDVLAKRDTTDKAINELKEALPKTRITFKRKSR